MPHPRLTRGDALRSRAEQILAEQATEHLDEEPVTRKIAKPIKKTVVKADKVSLTLGH